MKSETYPYYKPKCRPGLEPHRHFADGILGNISLPSRSATKSRAPTGLLAQRGLRSERNPRFDIERNYFDSAEIVLDDILIDFELDDMQLIGHENYEDYYEFMLYLYSNSKTIHDLDSLELLTLQTIADEPLGFAAGKARGILCFAYDICESDYGYASN